MRLNTPIFAAEVVSVYCKIRVDESTPSKVIVLIADVPAILVKVTFSIYVPGATVNTVGLQIPPAFRAATAAAKDTKLEPPLPEGLMVNEPPIAGALVTIAESFPLTVSVTLLGLEVQAFITVAGVVGKV